MKRVKITVTQHQEPTEVNAWQMDTPGLAAWNDGGKHLPWALFHVASGRYVALAYKRDQCVDLAARLADVCDWTEAVIGSSAMVETLEILDAWGREIMAPLYEAAAKRLEEQWAQKQAS